MDEWPDYIIKAFEAVDLADTEEDAEKAIESFASRWGGLDLETFQRVLETGQGQSKLIAIFALGYSGMPEARTLLLPLLHSPNRRERWASAVCLGEMQEEQVIPVLQDMLLEEEVQLTTNESNIEEAVRWDEAQRGRAASLLAGWNDLTMVPLLRLALQRSWQREQKMTLPNFPWNVYRHLGVYSQDAIAFALGRLGGFGALLNLVWPLSRLRIALIHLVLGYLYNSGYRYHNGILMEMIDNTILRQEVGRILEQRFGYSTTERVETIEQFLEDFLARQRAWPSEQELAGEQGLP